MGVAFTPGDGAGLLAATPNGVYMEGRRFYPRRCRGLLAATPNGVYIVPRQSRHIIESTMSKTTIRADLRCGVARLGGGWGIVDNESR